MGSSAELPIQASLSMPMATGHFLKDWLKLSLQPTNRQVVMAVVSAELRMVSMFETHFGFRPEFNRLSSRLCTTSPGQLRPAPRTR